MENKKKIVTYEEILEMVKSGKIRDGVHYPKYGKEMNRTIDKKGNILDSENKINSLSSTDLKKIMTSSFILDGKLELVFDFGRYVFPIKERNMSKTTITFKSDQEYLSDMQLGQYAVVDGTDDVVIRATVNDNDAWVIINPKKSSYYYTHSNVKCRILKSGDTIHIEV